MPSFFARLNPNGRMVVAGYPPADFGITMMADLSTSKYASAYHSLAIPALAADPAGSPRPRH